MQLLYSELASSKQIQQLADLVSRAKSAYYAGKNLRVRSEEVPESIKSKIRPNGSWITFDDKTYDLLEDLLRKLDPKNPALSVGAKVSEVKVKAKLPFYMGSLQKVRSAEDLAKWSEKYPGPYSVSEKLDGASLELGYIDGRLTKLYSRGDGTIGQDISYLAQHLDVPQKISKRGEVWIRGEGMISLSRFKQWSSEFKNPRNMASGLTNRKTQHEAHGDLQVLCYRMLSPQMPMEKGFDELHELGFLVPRTRLIKKLEVGELRTLMKTWRTKGKFEIDGLVIAQDKLVTDKPSLGGPANAVAFKDWEQDDSAVTIVEKVEWNLTRHGILFPRIVIKPVELRGTTVTHLSGKTAKFIVYNGIDTGAQIRVRRAGDVIPDLTEQDIIKKVRAKLPPDCTWDKNKVQITPNARNEQDTDRMRVLRLQHTFVTLGIDDLKAATLQNLIGNGYDSVTRILALSASPAKFAVAYGSRTGSKVADQIQQVLKTPQAAALLMDASGSFGKAIGTRKAQMAISKYPNLLKMAATETVNDIANTLLDVPGYHETTANQVAVGLPKFIKWLKLTGFKPITISKKVSGPLKGQVFCFTGFRDKEQAARIISMGGEYSDSLSTKTTVLVASDMTSTKVQVAKKRGITIMPRDKLDRYLDSKA